MTSKISQEDAQQIGNNLVKEKIINKIIDIEGGYVDDPSDSGGQTNWGITVKVARKAGYFGPMVDVSRDTAFVIYAEKYWDSVRADDILELSELVAEEVVDTSVNMGPSRAATFLQRSLNVLNDRERLYSDLTVDGSIGNITISRLKTCIAERGDLVLVKMLNCLQGAFYVELAERREKDERFVFGWFQHRVAL